LMKMNAVRLMASSVDSRDLKCSGRYFCGMDFRPGKFFGQGECDAARTSTDVDYPKFRNGRFARPPVEQECPPCTAGDPSYSVHHPLDHMFRFWTRDQYRWGHDQVHPPELLVSGNVLGGNADRSLSEGFLIAGLFLRSQ